MIHIQFVPKILGFSRYYFEIFETFKILIWILESFFRSQRFFRDFYKDFFHLVGTKKIESKKLSLLFDQ